MSELATRRVQTSDGRQVSIRPAQRLHSVFDGPLAVAGQCADATGAPLLVPFTAYEVACYNGERGLFDLNTSTAEYLAAV